MSQVGNGQVEALAHIAKRLASRQHGFLERPLSSASQRTIQTILSVERDHQAIIRRYEDATLQAKARSTIPLDRLTAAAAEDVAIAREMGDSNPLSLCPRYRLLAHLTTYFKREFFTWVDTLPCESCGASVTRNAGLVEPLPEDLRFGARRVESHKCAACGRSHRFPRYNDPAKLLETRRGRCGEWTNCFGLLLRSCGFEVRYLLDLTDHVWVEVFVEALDRWLHVDPCECQLDKPLLYEQGWGKKLTVVLAFHRSGSRDVTPRYTARLRTLLQTQRPRDLSGGALDAALTLANRATRAALPEGERRLWEIRDAQELVAFVRSHVGSRGAQAQARGGAAGPLPGRTTGSAAWRDARGESGRVPSCSAGEGREGSPPAGREVEGGTSWRRAPDAALASASLPDDLLAAHPSGAPPLRRLTGGFVRASGEHVAAGETAACAFDGSLSTKWLDFGAGGARWLDYSLPDSHEGVVIRGMRLVSGNDCPERDPCVVVLLGSPGNAAGTFEELGRWTDLQFSGRHLGISLTVRPSAKAFRCFRLVIEQLRDPSNGSCVQLTAWELFF